jgi:hypothetical protein
VTALSTREFIFNHMLLINGELQMVDSYSSSNDEYNFNAAIVTNITPEDNTLDVQNKQFLTNLFTSISDKGLPGNTYPKLNELVADIHQKIEIDASMDTKDIQLLKAINLVSERTK